MIPVVRHIMYHKPKEPDKKALKRVMWQRMQIRRASYERKFFLVIRATLNRQFKALADRVDVTNINSDTLPITMIDREPIEKMLIGLYQAVGTAFAKDTYRNLKSQALGMELKEEEVDEWYRFMEDFIKNRAGAKIVSIAESGRDQAIKLIREVVQLSTESGWGAEKTATEIKRSLINNGKEINKWRALRIARTEVVSASNYGGYAGALQLEKEGFEQVKYWLPVYDSRTRDTHRGMDAQNPKPLHEAFLVGGVWPAELPHDPDLPAEETINCRCGIQFGLK